MNIKRILTCLFRATRQFYTVLKCITMQWLTQYVFFYFISFLLVYCQVQRFSTIYTIYRPDFMHVDCRMHFLGSKRSTRGMQGRFICKKCCFMFSIRVEFKFAFEELILTRKLKYLTLTCNECKFQSKY